MFVFVLLLGAVPASGEELVGSTSCTDYLRMQNEDVQPGADQSVMRRHVTSLMHEYAKYVIREPDGKADPLIVNFIISYSTHYCQGHPTATVAEAGEAVGAAEKKAIAEAKAGAKRK
jgi:hypothetical protein